MNRTLSSMRLMNQHARTDPQLKHLYHIAKGIVGLFKLPAFYEMSEQCNLKCEGCYYFDSETYQPHRSTRHHFDGHWEAFLAGEAARGVTMPYFLGAEPALEKQRLVVASRYFRRGNIGTNGTVYLDPEIPFRISISAWAAAEGDDVQLRGGKALRRALKLYRDDPRAIVLYTLNRCNVIQARDMVRLCQDHGLPVTFNLWSPTFNLLSRLNHYTGNDDQFFRISTPEHSLRFSDEDLLRARDTLGQLIDDYPDTVIYSHAYNRWSTSPGPLYRLNEDSVAENCGSRILGSFKYYGMDLQPQAVKCCTPAVDCRECRLYSGGMSSQFLPKPEQVRSKQGFIDWLDIILTIGRIFLRPEIDPQVFVETERLAPSSSHIPFKELI